MEKTFYSKILHDLKQNKTQHTTTHEKFTGTGIASTHIFLLVPTTFLCRYSQVVPCRFRFPHTHQFHSHKFLAWVTGVAGVLLRGNIWRTSVQRDGGDNERGDAFALCSLPPRRWRLFRFALGDMAYYYSFGWVVDGWTWRYHPSYRDRRARCSMAWDRTPIL